MMAIVMISMVVIHSVCSNHHLPYPMNQYPPVVMESSLSMKNVMMAMEQMEMDVPLDVSSNLVPVGTE